MMALPAMFFSLDGVSPYQYGSFPTLNLLREGHWSIRVVL